MKLRRSELILRWRATPTPIAAIATSHVTNSRILAPRLTNTVASKERRRRAESVASDGRARPGPDPGLRIAGAQEAECTRQYMSVAGTAGAQDAERSSFRKPSSISTKRHHRRLLRHRAAQPLFGRLAEQGDRGVAVGFVERHAARRTLAAINHDGLHAMLQLA